jgi:uncharacterized membrane protein YphA (DoxX/SURF4 family)
VQTNISVSASNGRARSNFAGPGTTDHAIKTIARVSLGLVWIYEGLVPKIIFVHALPHQSDLVLRSGLWVISPAFTLITIGVAQTVLGLVLLVGWKERIVVALATAIMGMLIVLVVSNFPAMLTDPFGAIPKDLCLIACAAIVWLLSSKSRDAVAERR